MGIKVPGPIHINFLIKMSQTNQQIDGLLKASKNPEEDIQMVMYPGQPEHMRKYQPGYEDFFNQLFVLEDNDVLLEAKLKHNTTIMESLGNYLLGDKWLNSNLPAPGKFERHILAIQDPEMGVDNRVNHEGAEIVIAKWGDGHASPVHGHADGHLYEQILTGKMKVNIYRMHDREKGVVRLVKTDLIENQLLISKFSKKNPMAKWKRENVIHNFVSVGESVSLHFLPEHTRDGRDNTFQVEYFEDSFTFGSKSFERISAQEGMYSRIGDVILVRSSNVPELKDHYIVITGHPVMKEHGMRPQDVAIDAPHASYILDECEDNGLILLKLKPEVKALFLAFHGITIEGGEVKFPQP